MYEIKVEGNILINESAKKFHVYVIRMTTVENKTSWNIYKYVK